MKCQATLSFHTLFEQLHLLLKCDLLIYL